jgi:ECF transporter S component (folate family)
MSIETPIIRIGFGFLPNVIASIMFGPLLGGIAAATGDILGMLIFPKGAYFPGFTLTAFLGGVIYGLVLHNKKSSIKTSLLAVSIITIFINLGLNTLWLHIITGKAALAILIPRIIKSSIEFPVKISLIYSLWKLLEKIGFTTIEKENITFNTNKNTAS